MFVNEIDHFNHFEMAAILNNSRYSDFLRSHDFASKQYLALVSLTLALVFKQLEVYNYHLNNLQSDQLRIALFYFAFLCLCHFEI